MAKISQRNRQMLDGTFPSHIYVDAVDIYPHISGHTLFENSFFTRYLELDLNEELVEFPTFLLEYFYHNIVRNSDDSNPDILIINMPLAKTTVEPVKTTYSLIKSITVGFTGTVPHLRKLEMEKLGTFYGNKSVLMDENFEVLYYRGYRLTKPLIEIPEDTDRREFMTECCTPLFYINPKAFLDTSNAVNRFIATVMLPYYLERGDVDVSFKNLENLFKKPSSDLIRQGNFNEIINESMAYCNQKITFDI